MPHQHFLVGPLRALLVVATLAGGAASALAQGSPLERGRYLVTTVMACGNWTERSTCPLVKPMARPASRWPLGKLPTPERSSSATTEPLYRVSPVITAMSGKVSERNCEPKLNETK